MSGLAAVSRACASLRACLAQGKLARKRQARSSDDFVDQVLVSDLGAVDESQQRSIPPPLRGTLPPLRLARALRISTLHLVAAKARGRAGPHSSSACAAEEPALQLSGRLHSVVAESFDGSSSGFVRGYVSHSQSSCCSDPEPERVHLQACDPKGLTTVLVWL